MTERDHWQFFNWPEIIREARLRQADDRQERPLEYWTAWCAHANLAACIASDTGRAMSTKEAEGWQEAVIAWSVCASLHREYCKGKDPFYKTRQADFVDHESNARAKLKALTDITPDRPQATE